MDVTFLLKQLDSEIARVQAARDQIAALQTGASAPSKHQDEAGKRPKRVMTPEGRARIAAAQKARWAKKDY